MNNKRIRYITTILTLDKISQSIEITIWDNKNITNIIKEEEKHFGLDLISVKEEISVTIEYTNIIWNYRIYYGTYKKKYKPLLKNDERWLEIEKQIISDLKIMGLDSLKEKILLSLKNKQYFEYKIKIEKQFKKYCI